MKLSRQLLLLLLWLTVSNKVKQLHGVCISCNKETTLRLLPVVLIDMQVMNFLQNMIISHINIYRITTCLGKQVRCPLLCCCKFCVADTGNYQEPFLTTQNHNGDYQVCCFNLLQGPAVVKFDSTKVGETDTRQPPLCKTSCMSVDGTVLMCVDM